MPVCHQLVPMAALAAVVAAGGARAEAAGPVQAGEAGSPAQALPVGAARAQLVGEVARVRQAVAQAQVQVAEGGSLPDQQAPLGPVEE